MTENKSVADQWTPRFEYNADKVDTYTPDLPGVYRLIYKTAIDGKDDYFIFYVGQTDNLYKALLEILNGSDEELSRFPSEWFDPTWIKKYLKEYQCYFRFIIARSKKERNKIEKSPDHDFIPRGDMEFALWADNFIRVLSENAAKWKIPPEAWTKLASSHEKYMASYDAHLKAKSALRAARKKLQKPPDARPEGEQ